MGQRMEMEQQAIIPPKLLLLAANIWALTASRELVDALLGFGRRAG